MARSSSVSSTRGKLSNYPAATRGSQGKYLPQVHEKKTRGQKDPAWIAELDSLEMSFELFDDWMYSKPEHVLEIFQSLKQNQHNIEALLRERAKRRDFSSPPLGQALHQWLNTVNAKIRDGHLVLKKCDLHGLQTMALGITACISLGHPNLFAKQDANGGKAAIDDLKLTCEALIEAFLAIKEDAQQECPGAVLNIHNLVARLTKADLFPATSTMRQASARCFSLMLHWSGHPDAKLERLGGDVEQGNIEAEIVKRAGKAAVQVESFCDNKHKLLPLNGVGQEVQSNRASLIKLVDWLGSPSAIDLYLRNGQEGIVALSSVAHLYSRLLHWHYLPLEANTRARLATLFHAITRVDPEYKSADYIQAMSNFGGALNEAIKPGRTALWKGATRDEQAQLEGACQVILADMAGLSTATLDLRSSVPLFALLRSVEGWLARHDKACTGTPTTTTTVTASTTSPTTTTSTTSTTATTSAPTVPDVESSASAASREGMELIRKRLGPAVNGVLPSLTVEAMHTQKRPDHITAVLDILCWLSRSPEMVGELKTLLVELAGRICACVTGWPASGRASVASNLAGLIKHGLVSESDDLYNAVLGRPESGTKHRLQDLLAAAEDVEPLDIATPLAFQMPAQTAPEEASPSAAQGAQGALSGAAAKSREPKPTYRGPTPASIPPPRRAPAFTPEPRYRKMTAGVTPPASVPSQPLATVVVDDEEIARMARDEPSRGQTKTSPPDAKKPVSGRNRKKNKAGASGAATKLSSKQAKAAGEAQLKIFEDELRKAMEALPAPAADAAPRAQPLRSAVATVGALKQAARGGKEKAASLQSQPHPQTQTQTQTQTQGTLAPVPDVGKDQSEFPPLPVEVVVALDAIEKDNANLEIVRKTLKVLRKLADEGHARAQLRLSRLLWSGDVGIPEPKLAMEFLRKAAKLGLPDALYDLGMLLGHSTEAKSITESERLLRLAVASGHLEAGPSLATMLWADAGKLTDRMKAAVLEAEAVTLWRQAADKGHVDSKFQLGRCYQQGKGITQNVREGQRWIEEAARDGHEKAQSALASLQAGKTMTGPKPLSTCIAAPKAASLSASISPLSRQANSTPLDDGLEELPQPLADNLRKLNRNQLSVTERLTVLEQLHTAFLSENNSARYQVGLMVEAGEYARFANFDKLVGRNLIVAAGANGLKAAHRHLRPLFEEEGTEHLPGELACRLFTHSPAVPTEETRWLGTQLAMLLAQGNPSAMYRMGLMLSEGNNEIAQDIGAGKSLIGNAARQGLKAAKAWLKRDGLTI